MKQEELNQEFLQLYRKADYQTRKKIDKELHKIISKKKGERLRKEAFFKAVKDGNTKAVENILNEENHVDINTQDEKLGNTALIYAVLNGFREIVKLILKKGADPSVKNNQGKNSLDAVEFSKSKNEIKSLLIKYNQKQN